MNKVMFRISACALILIACGATKASAQATATASATATIITPITISKTTDMNFGNVAIQASSVTAGTVVLSPASGRTPSSNITLPTGSGAGTIAAAAFTVSGQSGYTYAITLPASALSIQDNSSNTMSVDSWTSSPSATGTLTGGSQTLTVGATLHVAAGQAAGTYTSPNNAPFSVTVNYN